MELESVKKYWHIKLLAIIGIPMLLLNLYENVFMGPISLIGVNRKFSMFDFLDYSRAVHLFMHDNHSM
jgi:hypothetical protein